MTGRQAVPMISPVRLWREHQARMAAKLGKLATGAPSPKTHEHDRYALRALPALGLAVAFAYSFGSGGGRISDIWTGPAAAAPVPPRIDAWVTPPRYTGKAPIFLTNAQDTGPATITVPENSELTVRIGVTAKPGDTGPAFALLQDGKPVTVPAKSDAPVSGRFSKGFRCRRHNYPCAGRPASRGMEFHNHSRQATVDHLRRRSGRSAERRSDARLQNC